MIERIRLADHLARAMISREYGDTVMWGDGILGDVATGLVTGKLGGHPLNRMIAMLNACERAPDLFEKRHIRAHDSNGKPRLVRGFKLIGEPRRD